MISRFIISEQALVNTLTMTVPVDEQGYGKSYFAEISKPGEATNGG